MFKKVPFFCDVDTGSVRYHVQKVVSTTDGESVDSVLVDDFSFNFSDYPRQLESKNFSIDAQQKSGLSLKEVNSVMFHDSELNDAELEKIESVINDDVKSLNDD